MTNRATDYAHAVLCGDIIAGPYVRAACKRYLDDNPTCDSPDNPNKNGYYYDQAEVTAAYTFFEKILCLGGGEHEGKPFNLLPWQAFIIGNIFGWKDAKTKYRRYRVAYIETAKGSGKSPLVAGIGMKGLVADGEYRAEIYAAATTKDQAQVLFKDALTMLDYSPYLNRRLETSGGNGDRRWNIYFPAKSSYFRVVSADNKKSGLRPHMALLDEIHEAPNGDIIEMLRAGFKNRRQPLSVMITNSGDNMTSVCREYHEMAVKIAQQTIVNDQFFSYVCSLDEDDLHEDKYLKDETCWVKSNPSLDYGLPGFDSIRSQVNEALGLPSKLAKVKRLHFNVWTEAKNPWISKDVWVGCCGEKYDFDSLKNRRCWGGLDLSRVNDLTAYVLVFEPIPSDNTWRVVPFFWIPGDLILLKTDQDHVPYDSWRDNGYLFAPSGKSINKGDVIRHIKQTSIDYDLQGIAYDRALVDDLFQYADYEGIDLSEGKWDTENKKWGFGFQSGIKIMPFGQYAKSMHPAIEKLECLLKDNKISHNNNPVLTWCAANAVIDEKDGYRKLDKRKSTGRIDGIVAAVMAFGIASTEDTNSIYESRGVIAL